MNILTEAEREALAIGRRIGQHEDSDVAAVVAIVDRLAADAESDAVHVDPVTAGGLDDAGRVFVEFPHVGRIVFTDTSQVRDLCMALGALAADADHLKETGKRL